MCRLYIFVGIKDMMAWTDMETFRRLPRFMDEKRDQKAKDVKKAWLAKKYFFGPDSPATREGQDLVSNTHQSFGSILGTALMIDYPSNAAELVF